MADNVVLLGAQWGDEGKGKIVDLLTEKADAVARFQGGHNAGHTLTINNRQTVFHLVPSGAMRDGVECLIGNGVVVNIEQLLKEIKGLEEIGVSTRQRLMVSLACPIIMPHHVALDIAREAARGNAAIGTTCRGIGPCYEDKVARRGLRMVDLLQAELFASKLEQVLEYHNFVLTNYFKVKAVDYQQSLEQAMSQLEQVKDLVGDVSARLYQLHQHNKSVMFEGAQGMLLDVDHGTYPYVTSSNTTAAIAAAGTGIGPLGLDYVLGVVKAYTTRVGSGPFPTELFDAVGQTLGQRGHEFGTTTGRPRRCGWLDMVALRRSVQVSGISALCVTKLDVMDSLESVKICTSYERDGKRLTLPPYGAELMVQCLPIYEQLPGWQETTAGVRDYAALPQNARAYLERISALSGIPIDIVSTGAERDDTIVLKHPFES